MMKLKKLTTALFIVTTILFNANSQEYPMSDSDNQGKWILNGDFSDEFEGDSLNRSRWHIQGEYADGCEGDACRDGIYYNGFKGRWPAQFSKDNAKLEDGKLILETRWEPDFNFLNNCDTGNTGYCYGKDLNGNLLPITTAGVNSLKQFKYGYMEISSKAADAEITSSFWTIGSGAEFDMFEMFGKYEQSNKKYKEKELKFNMIEWETGFEPRFDTFISMDWRVADSFHVYGFEWNETSISVYIDGEFIQTYTAADFDKGSGEEWFYTGSQRLWVDQEAFPWNGLPNQEDLNAQYEIQYIRVWQKENQIEDTTAPLLSRLDTSLAKSGGQVSLTTSEQSRLYLVPSNTPKDQNSIESINSNPIISNENTTIIKTQNFEPNSYIIYAIDWAGNISEATATFMIESTPILGLNSNTTSINVVPNPGNNIIQLIGLEVNTDSVVLVSTSGKTYKRPVLNNMTLDISNLTPGIYIIHISGQPSIKFLKD